LVQLRYWNFNNRIKTFEPVKDLYLAPYGLCLFLEFEVSS